MPDKKINILIFTEAEGTLLGVLRSLKGLNYKLNLLIDHCPENLLTSRFISRYMRFDSKQGDDHVYNKLKEAIDFFKPDVLLSLDVPSNKLVARHYDDLSELTKVCLVPSEGCITTTDNKWEMAKFCKQAGIPHPRSICLNESSHEDIKKLNFPILVKLAYSVGGIGTIFIENEDELEEKLKQIPDASRLYLCQEFKKGSDIVCNFYAVDGEIKHYNIQKGVTKLDSFSAASEWEYVENEDLLKVSSLVARAMNWSGIANLDFLHEKSTDSYIFLELNPRFWHSIIGATAVGINYPHLMIQHALGKDLEPDRSITGRFYMRKPRIGRIIKERYKFKNTALWYELIDPLPLLTDKFNS